MMMLGLMQPMIMIIMVMVMLMIMMRTQTMAEVTFTTAACREGRGSDRLGSLPYGWAFTSLKSLIGDELAYRTCIGHPEATAEKDRRPSLHRPCRDPGKRKGQNDMQCGLSIRCALLNLLEPFCE